MSVIVHELKQEFSAKGLGFTFPKAEAFYTCQWKWPPVLFLIYRVIIAGFTVGTLSAYVSIDSMTYHHLMAYMTTWCYILLTLHFNVSALIVLYRFCRRFCLSTEEDPEDNAALRSISSSSCSPSHSTGYEMDNCNEPCHIGDAMNNCVLPGHQNTENRSDGLIDNIQHSSPTKQLPNPDGKKLATSRGCTLPGDHHYMNIIESGGSPALSKKMAVKDFTFGAGEDQTRWYMKVSWFLFDIVASSAVIVTFLYFGFIYPILIDTDSFVDISVHGINTVLVAIEIMVSAFPVRLLHAIYPIIFGILYIIFTLVYWAQDPDINIIYFNILNWNEPKTAIILVCVLFFIAIPILQSVIFLLYKFRLYCYLRFYKENYTT